MAGPYSIKADFNVPIQMRDGTTTYADIFRPDAPGEKFPVLLTRTPTTRAARKTAPAPSTSCAPQ